MISDLFPNLEPEVIEPHAEQGKASAAPAALKQSRNSADSLFTPVAPGLRSDRQVSEQLKGTIIDHARKQVAKEIIALMGDDVPSPTRYQKYLEKQSLEDLQARRQQLQEENQRDFQFYAATQRRMKR